MGMAENQEMGKGTMKNQEMEKVMTDQERVTGMEQVMELQEATWPL